MPKPKKDIRNKWKELMKATLHQAVVKILSKDGLQGLTMDCIAHEVGIAKGTLYIYFKDKQELLEYVVHSSLEPLETEHDKIFVSDLSAPKKLESFANSTLGYFDENRNFFRVILDPELSGPRMHRDRKNRHRELASKLSVVFEQGMSEGYFKKADPMKLAGMFMACCFVTNIERLWMENTASIEEDARLILDVFQNGISKAGKKI